MTEIEMIQLVAEELNLKALQVKNTIELLDTGNTVPFIARYRKEVTGSLDENQIRAIQERMQYLRALEARKETILKSIEEQGKLTPELKEKFLKQPNYRKWKTFTCLTNPKNAHGLLSLKKKVLNR